MLEHKQAVYGHSEMNSAATTEVWSHVQHARFHQKRVVQLHFLIHYQLLECFLFNNVNEEHNHPASIKNIICSKALIVYKQYKKQQNRKKWFGALGENVIINIHIIILPESICFSLILTFIYIRLYIYIFIRIIRIFFI